MSSPSLKSSCSPPIKGYADKKAECEKYLEVIRNTIVTEQGKKDFNNIIKCYDSYFTVNESVLELGGQLGNPSARSEAERLLNNEVEKAYQEATTPNCREKCSGCGANKLGGERSCCPKVCK